MYSCSILLHQIQKGGLFLRGTALASLGHGKRGAPATQPLNPCGFADCQRQASVHMVSIFIAADQPSSSLARVGSA
jgi:hypothetical protein